MNANKGYWPQFWQRRLSRRRLIAGAAIGGAGLASAVVIGCAEEKPPAGPEGMPTGAESKTPAREPKRGGVLTHGSDTNRLFFGLRGFDPHTQIATFGYFSGGIYQNLLCYGPGVFVGEELRVQPEIAQSWQQPSPTEYLFTLQPGVKWHNKPPANARLLTAEDVVFSLGRARTAEARFLHRRLFETVDKIQVADKGTVRITTKRPEAALLAKVGADPVKVLAPEVIETFG